MNGSIYTKSMTPEFNRSAIILVFSCSLLLVFMAGILALFVPSGNKLVHATSRMHDPELFFDKYFIKGVSLTRVAENGHEVNLHAKQIIHRDRTILDRIVLVSLNEVFIDTLELSIRANEPSIPDKSPAKGIMDSFPVAVARPLSGTSEGLTRILVDKFSASYTFPQQTQLWIQSETARLYEGLYIFEGRVDINSSRGDRFITRLAVWDKSAGGFLMPYGYQNNSDNTENSVFVALNDDGTLMSTDYYPESNWETVDIVEQMKRKLAKQIIESMGMFFLKAANQ